MKKIIFICGVNGVGKSSVIPYLKLLLPNEHFVIHDFDERGVPENAGTDWRKTETKHWLSLADENQRNLRISTVICGFIKITDLEDVQREIGVDR